MSSQNIKAVARRLARLTIIFISLGLTATSAFSQKKFDSTAFRKDFEVLLKKYGIKSSSYQVNVVSLNQRGGQTALVINNNYYGDTVDVKTNVTVSIVEIDSLKYYSIAPKSGIWQQPFVFTKVTEPRKRIALPGFKNQYDTIRMSAHGKEYYMHGETLTVPISKSSQLLIQVGPNGSQESFLFGDYIDSKKVYIYRNGEISYLDPEGR